MAKNKNLEELKEKFQKAFAKEEANEEVKPVTEHDPDLPLNKQRWLR